MGKRIIEKHIKYNAEEWEIISRNAAALGKRTGTYIREMSVQSVIKNYDMQQFNHLIVSFNRIGNELNQIAKVVNSTQAVYGKDIEDMKKSFKYFRAVFENYLLPLECEVLT
ncbi:MAG: MobC family plasmid mobilization relaxosome protein [Eubacterium sp.]|nr:MobC family plasmid mobilization relaxosome protein [Eubacterium sp.]